MKKSILLVALTCSFSGVFAQDLTSKKGEPILPEAGDWAISMNADPFFTYLGNAFNGSINHAGPNTGFLGNQTIVGKKFIDEKNAYRLILRVGFTSINDKNMVIDDKQTGQTFSFPEVQGRVEDKRSIKNTNIGLGVGKEMRRGKTRLQGFYGADAMIWMSMRSVKYKYGNIMSDATVASTTGSATTTNPTTTDFNTVLPGGGFASGGKTTRQTKVSDGLTFGIGVRGFIGAEYFLLPKISIGAEYGLGLGFQLTTKGKIVTEEQGGTPNSVAEVERQSAGSSRLGLDTDINQGNLFGFAGGTLGSASLKVTFHF